MGRGSEGARRGARVGGVGMGEGERVWLAGGVGVGPGWIVRCEREAAGAVFMAVVFAGRDCA
jgi:hypothetical protein